MVIESNVKIEEVTTDTITAYSKWKKSKYWSAQRRIPRTQCSGREDRDIIKLSGPWKFRIEGSNALLLNSWKVNIDTERQGDKDKYYSVELDDGSGLTSPKVSGRCSYRRRETRETYPVTSVTEALLNANIPEDLRIIIDGIKGDKKFTSTK